MNQSWRRWSWKVAGASLSAMGGAIATSGNCALAQVTPDGTLPNNSIVTPQGNTSLIEGGTQKGSNLFHSFEQFSVPTGGEAFFNNALDIQNIISRVTGESISNIDGLLRANGTANLFLLNPNGIIFGPNASLNIGGSFLGSTASSLNFADGTQFSATASQTTPLLTISVPIGLQYGGTAGSIRNQSQATNSSGETVGLQVQPGKTLSLVGGDVRLDNGTLFAPGGRVELGGVAGAGTVGLNVDGNNLSLSYPTSVQRADISLTNDAFVDVATGGLGSIAVNAHSLDVLGGSLLSAGIRTGLGSVGSQSGDITLNATGAITVAGSDINNFVRSRSVGNGGNINITTGSLSVTNGAQLLTSTRGQGNAGSVNIHAGNTVSFDGVDSNQERSAVFSNVGKGAVGNGGDINITTGSLSVTNGARLNVSTNGQGNAGSVNIHARNTVSLDGVGSNRSSSGAFSTVDEEAVGKGGSINITTGSLSVTNGARLNVGTNGQGNAGSVNIHAGSTASFDGVGSNGRTSGAFSNVLLGALGKGGSINITAESLSFTNGAQLDATTFAQGDAGSVNIHAGNTVSFDGVGSNQKRSAVFSVVAEGAVGKGGDINITTGSLSMTNGAQLNASTNGQGNAGSMNIHARNTVTFDGVGSNRRSSGAFSTVNEGAVGNGGGIDITTGSLRVANGARLNVSTNGQGNAGSVNIHARNTVSFDGVGSNRRSSGAFSTVNEGAVGKGGSINITTGSLSFTNRAQLNASSAGNGAAGNIEVEASSIRLDNKAFLSSDTVAGQGNIFLDSQDLVLRRGSNITTNAQGTATGGNINIDTGVIAALEDSDISANAQNAFGGRVIIDAQGIFGTEFREIENPATSDITATSELGPEFSGTVEINTPDVDPSRGLVNLPAVPVDTEVAQACTPGGSQAQSEFVITGRGGLPPNPGDALSTDAVMVDLVTLNPEVAQTSNPAVSPRSTSSTPPPIVEAQGWVIDAKGNVTLIANAPTERPIVPQQRTADCRAFNQQQRR